ncbi:MAG: hypothetical protein H6709_18735 [Kofleriaceae bacterium]|nr:hypothetical protein [Kofleriaceae bacterium]
MALAEALSRSLPALALAPSPAGEPGAPPLPRVGDDEVLVRVRGVDGAQATALLGYLAGAQGVKRAQLRQLQPGAVVLGVTGLEARRITALVRAAPDLGATARLDDGVVEAAVGGAGR